MKNSSFKLSILALLGFINNGFADTRSSEEIIKQLGWVPDTKMICNGYYEDPLAAFSGIAINDLKNAPVEINADQISLQQTNTSVLQGHVTVTQPGRSIQANEVKLNRDDKTGEAKTANLNGNVVLREPNKIVIANQGQVELKTHAGNLVDVLYRLLVGSANSVSNTNTRTLLNAWGEANTAEQDSSGKIKLQNTTYTTCAPTANTWHVSANQIYLDPEAGVGTAHHTWISLQNIPVFYSPYLTFPIDNRRRSGFLFPNLSHSSLSGYGLSVPYYWNIAPNYDLLITPQLLTKRGLQINGLFRYLVESGQGSFNVGFIPDDREFAHFKNDSSETYPATTPGLNKLLNRNNNRGFFTWQDTHTLAPRWISTINYNYVSDDYYLQDFGGINVMAQNQLLRQAKINYVGDTWNFMVNLQGYQTLHLINQSVVTNAYQKLPELSLNGSFTNQALGLNYQFINQLVYFRRDANPGEDVRPPETLRLNIQPSVDLPFIWSAGYLKPTLQLSAKSYQISNQPAGFANNIQRVIPMLSIDSGLYFDRHTQWKNHNYQQTLEPRLFYLYVPYRNQDMIPVFDSALIPFSYDSLFLTNRFSGYDRIGDANQIALALTTRFLDEASGAEKFRASIGELFYFRDRKVGLCGSVDSIVNSSLGATCYTPDTLAGMTSLTETTSPIAAQMRYSFSEHWNTTANVAWDPNTGQTISGNLNLQYQPTTNRVFNINYNYLRFGDMITDTAFSVAPNSHRNDLNQGGFSLGWPVGEHWAAVGGWNYNFGRSYFQTYFYGLQYDSCCWSMRVIAGRTFSSLNENGNPYFNNTVYLQWQLKGLGTVGNGDPSNLLLNNIPGYQDRFKANLNM